MDQQQFKIRMSVSTKLLLVIIFLVTAPIIFLNFSAIAMFRSDKKAHVYDSQATEAVLAGREFVSYLHNSLGILKLIVGSADLTQPVSDQMKNMMQFYLESQTLLLGAELYVIDPSTRQARRVYQQFLPSALEQVGLQPEGFKYNPQTFEQRRKELDGQGYFFVNVSQKDQPPVLAVVYSDPWRAKAQGQIPVAVGYLGLTHFLAGIPNSFNKFLIADRTGAVLFHTDTKLLYENPNMAQDALFKEAWTSVASAGAREYLSQSGAFRLASYYKPGLELVSIAQIDYDRAMQSTDSFIKKFVLLEIPSLILTIILGLIFSKRITAPLNRLFMATAQVSEGKFNVNLPTSSYDEIGALTTSFVAMSRRISELLQQHIDKVRVGNELEIAKIVQQSLFPEKTIQNDHLLLVSEYQSASECGGDWLGYFRNRNKHTIVIADATGHGLPSALMTASARACFSVVEKLTSDPRFIMDPAQMLNVANRVVYDSAQGKIMMTCFVCVLDFDAHTITYSSAAHNPAWLFSRNEDGTTKLVSLMARGARLGEAQEINKRFEVNQMPFKPGDTLVFYTDGLLDAKNAKGEVYGKKRMRAILEEAIKHDPHTIVKNLMTDFNAHYAGDRLDDDITIAIARLLV